MNLAADHVSCNLCGADDAKGRFASAPVPHAAGDGHFDATTDRFGGYGTICECRRCGFVYTNPRLADDRLLDEYECVSDPDYSAEADSRSINAHLCLATIRTFAPEGRLLDIGCATGFFLNAARVTYDVTGVEPSRWARKYAAEQLKIAVAARTIEEAQFPADHFDVVTLIDVVEHLADPTATMREVRRVTRPGGIVYLVTPDIGSMSARLLRGAWWGLRPAHLSYFSRRTLSLFLDKAGYEVLLVRSYGRIFTWRYWLSRLAGYPRLVRWSAGVVTAVFGREDKVLYLDTRDSLQVVARKRA